MQIPHPITRAEGRAKRAAEAYRMADRLGRSSRHTTEWRRLCRADKTRQSFYAFEDMFEKDDAAFEEIDTPDVQPDSDPVRMAYFAAAVAVGTLSLFLGAAFVI